MSTPVRNQGANQEIPDSYPHKRSGPPSWFVALIVGGLFGAFLTFIFCRSFS